jgi:hypothetical protein
MRPRICRKSVGVKWLSASWRMKHRACRMRHPPVLNRRCCRRVTTSSGYHRLAQVQYRHGLADYLVVLDAERTLLANQLSLARAVNLQMGASIRLIKALGGGWAPPAVAAAL